MTRPAMQLPAAVCNGIAHSLAFLALVPLLYLAVLGRYGWSHSDDGFILGYGWRIFNGEIPYRDFIYVRPPGSIALHSIWFWLVPKPYIFIAARAAFCVQIMGYSMMAAYVLSRAHGVPLGLQRHWRLWGALGFAMSACVLPPLPWHTVDGVFFSMGSFFVVWVASGTPRHRLWCAFAGMLAIAGALCKQSFYPFPLMALVVLLWRGDRAAAVWFAVGAVLSGLGFYVLMLQLGAWHDFVSQTQGSASIKDALQAGVLPYFKSFSVIGVPFIAVFALWRFVRSRVEGRTGEGVEVLIFAGVVAAVFFALCLKFGDARQAFVNLWLDQALWIAGVFRVVSEMVNKRRPFEMVVLLGLAWCSSISWGFMTTALFSMPGLVGAWLFFKPYSLPSSRAAAVAVVACLSFATVRAGLTSVDDARPWLRCDLGEVDSLYTGIVTSSTNCAKVKDLKEIANRLPSKRLVVLPAFTTAYMLLGVRNVIPIDQPTATEMGSLGPIVTATFLAEVDFAIVERDSEKIFAGKDPSGRFKVPLLDVARTNFRPYQSTEHFEVLINPRVK